MKHQESHFTGVDETRIFYQSWLPEEEVKGVLIVVHGFGEHSGRYTNVVETVVPEGIGVYALDHRGHGRSEGKENHVNRFTDFIEDVGTFEEIVIAKHPDIPLFMLGHSMGSLIANHFMASSPNLDRYSALVLSGTGSENGPEINGFTIFLAKVLSFIAPRMSIPSNLDPNFISRDPKAVEAYINDPLVHYDKITARLGAEMMKRANSMTKAASDVHLPTLIQVGSEDQAFMGEEELHDAFPSNHKELKVYEGFLHEVYNELEKEVPLKDLKEWLLRYLP